MHSHDPDSVFSFGSRSFLNFVFLKFDLVTKTRQWVGFSKTLDFWLWSGSFHGEWEWRQRECNSSLFQTTLVPYGCAPRTHEILVVTSGLFFFYPLLLLSGTFGTRRDSSCWRDQSLRLSNKRCRTNRKQLMDKRKPSSRGRYIWLSHFSTFFFIFCSCQCLAGVVKSSGMSINLHIVIV